jgi:hypothetical protein
MPSDPNVSVVVERSAEPTNFLVLRLEPSGERAYLTARDARIIAYQLLLEVERMDKHPRPM